MKYFTILVFVILVWIVLAELVFKDRSSEGLTSVREKLKDLGGRFHLAMGILAVLIAIYFVARFFLRAIESP
jgi:hypothetical protein